MTSYTNYLPRREAPLIDFMQEFIAVVSPAPENYGLDLTQAQAMIEAVDAFAAAYAVANNNTTRTPVAIQEKNAAKKQAIRVTRQTVGICQAWPEMTNAKRTALKISLRDEEPTPIGPPEEMPVLSVRATGQVLDLTLRSPTGERQKPEGVRAAFVYTFVGESPVGDLTRWEFRGGTTRSDPQIVMDSSVTPGTKVWVTAQWVNPRDVPGPACAPVATHVGFEGLNQAA